MERVSEVFATLLSRVHGAGPHQFAGLVADAAARLGASDMVLYLVDYEETMLSPLPVNGTQRREPVDVETTLAGRAYCFGVELEGDGPTGRRLWIPLLNASSRLGVVEFGLPGPTSDHKQLRDDCWLLARLAGELIDARSGYTDLFEIHRRLAPATLAAEVQRNLLPSTTLITEQVAVAGALAPAYEVAGDAFDYALNDPVLHLCVIDAIGHGLDASLLASLALASYRHSRRQGLDLHGVLTAMDDVVAAHGTLTLFVTALLAELDVTTGQLRLLNAGHPAPLLLRGGSVVGNLTVEPTLPAGLHGLGNDDVLILEQRLEPGDRMLAYTDGVVESRTPTGEILGVERLIDLAEQETAAGHPVPETMRRLIRAVTAHAESQLDDDATLLYVEWRASR